MYIGASFSFVLWMIEIDRIKSALCVSVGKVPPRSISYFDHELNLGLY